MLISSLWTAYVQYAGRSHVSNSDFPSCQDGNQPVLRKMIRRSNTPVMPPRGCHDQMAHARPSVNVSGGSGMG